LFASAVAAVVAGVVGLAAAAQSGDVERGRAVYSYWCAPCHAAGPGHPGTQALQAKYNGDIPAVLVEREDLSPEIVATFVRQGVSVMAPFRKTEVSDADLAALSAYLVQAHTEN
jgi:mono/diheme cytochrome c family protein